MADVADRARNMLGLIKSALSSGIPFENDHGTCDTPISRALLRESAAKTITLLKNDRGVLPLDRTKLKKIAIIGDCARICNSSGGGSASVPVETYTVTPFDAISELLREHNVEVRFAQGTRSYKYTPTIDPYLLHPHGAKEDPVKVGLFEGWSEEPSQSWKAGEANLTDTSSPSFSVDHSSEKICFLDGGYGEPGVDTEARFVRVS